MPLDLQSGWSVHSYCQHSSLDNRANGHDAHISHHYHRHGNTVHSTLKKKVRQANEKSSEFQKGVYRDGEETSQGSTLHDLADCETLRNSLDDVIPLLLPGVCIHDLS